MVLLARRAAWESLASVVERDPRAAQKPQPVAREPEKRPFADPRAFVPALGQSVRLTLRNGIGLHAPLTAVGPFDLLLTLNGHQLFVPIHAVTKWSSD